MIAYAPIDFDEPETVVVPQKPVKRKVPVKVDENTECNYVVLFFIVGVVALAAMDSIGK